MVVVFLAVVVVVVVVGGMHVMPVHQRAANGFGPVLVEARDASRERRVMAVHVALGIERDRKALGDPNRADRAAFKAEGGDVFERLGLVLDLPAREAALAVERDVVPRRVLVAAAAVVDVGHAAHVKDVQDDEQEHRHADGDEDQGERRHFVCICEPFFGGAAPKAPRRGSAPNPARVGYVYLYVYLKDDFFIPFNHEHRAYNLSLDPNGMKPDLKKTNF